MCTKRAQEILDKSSEIQCRRSCFHVPYSTPFPGEKATEITAQSIREVARVCIYGRGHWL